MSCNSHYLIYICWFHAKRVACYTSARKVVWRGCTVAVRTGNLKVWVSLRNLEIIRSLLNARFFPAQKIISEAELEQWCHYKGASETGFYMRDSGMSALLFRVALNTRPLISAEECLKILHDSRYGINSWINYGVQEWLQSSYMWWRLWLGVESVTDKGTR